MHVRTACQSLCFVVVTRVLCRGVWHPKHRITVCSRIPKGELLFEDVHRQSVLLTLMVIVNCTEY